MVFDYLKCSVLVFCFGDVSSFLFVIYKSNGYWWYNGLNCIF